MAYTMKLLSITLMAAAICFFFLLAMEMESHSLDYPKMVAGEIKSRKVELRRSENDGNNKKKKVEWEWELREAPMGPDPLHHHGSSPISRTRKQP